MNSSGSVRRTSAATMRANQLRLYLSSAAYMLMHALQRTPLARAQCQTIRLKLLKIDAQVRLTVRHVWKIRPILPLPSFDGHSSALLRSSRSNAPKNEIVSRPSSA